MTSGSATVEEREIEIRCPACGRFVGAARSDCHIRLRCENRLCRAEILAQVCDKEVSILILSRKFDKL